MNRRLVKEFRSLRLPWVIALGAAGLMAIKDEFVLAFRNELQIETVLNNWVMFGLQAAPIVFLASLALLAALSYGTEFQQRTLPLFLSQPLARSRMWREKTFVLFASVVAAGLSYGLWVFVLHRFFSGPLLFESNEASSLTEPVLLGGTFLLATACSAGFWTLVTRSTIGGMALGAGSLCVLFLGVTELLDRIYGPDLDFHDSRNINALVAAGVIYAAIFQWLGWRKFARLQLRFPISGQGLAGTESFAGIKWEFDWLRCRPASGVGNLIRKEIRLNKGLFLVALVFTICWLLTLVLLFMWPMHEDKHFALFIMLNTIITAVYIPLMFLLAGAMSLGEEKSLGLNAWQLTLPVSVRRQWLVKLSVALLLAIVLGIGLPLLLSWLTAPKVKVGLLYLMEGKDNGRELLLIGGGLIFLIGFWASTLLSNTITAALATVFALPVLGGCVALAETLTPSIRELGMILLSWSIAHFQLPPDCFWREETIWKKVILLCVVPFLLLCQSLAQFRRAQPQRYALLRYSFTLAGVCFCIALGWAAFDDSARQVETGRLRLELQDALLSLPGVNMKATIEQPAAAPPRVVTFKELEETGKLSPEAKIWLANTSISFEAVKSPVRGGFMLHYSVNMVFPKARPYSFNFQPQRRSW